MRGKVSTPEEIASEIPSGQPGNVPRAQLLDAGVSGSAIDRRLIRGHLIPRHRGVYRVGHEAPSTEATYMAAVLAAGGGALLPGRAAAHLMRLLKGAAPPPEVLALTGRRIKGVRSRERARSTAARQRAGEESPPRRPRERSLTWHPASPSRHLPAPATKPRSSTGHSR